VSCCRSTVFCTNVEVPVVCKQDDRRRKRTTEEEQWEEDVSHFADVSLAPHVSQWTKGCTINVGEIRFIFHAEILGSCVLSLLKGKPCSQFSSLVQSTSNNLIYHTTRKRVESSLIFGSSS
jgi:hypothetical protein